jgi:hypothetical protein
VRRAFLILALGGLLVGVVADGLAGTTTSWSRVTDNGGRNIDEVGLARTRDGVLHVAWRIQGAGAAGESLRHATIQPNGRVGPATTAVGGLGGLSNPDLVVGADGGLLLFYGAITPTPSGVRMSSAGQAGMGWSGPQKVSSDSQGGDPGAAVDKNGTPVFAWAAGTNTYYKLGTDAGQQDGFLGPSPKCCYYDPEVAVDDAGGAGFVAYHSNATGEPGIFVRQILPSLGAPQLAPRVLTGGSFLQPDHRVPLVARQGGGVFLAYCSGYPTCKQVLLWRVGGNALLVKGGGQDVEDVNLARGPDGRLWVMWQDSGQLYAGRTNGSATKAGAIVRISPPPGTSSVWDVFGEGSLGQLDLLAEVSVGNAIATWHRQVLPGLSLSCAARGKNVRCSVRDAGDPVRGAAVRIGGSKLTTAANGTVSAKLPAGAYAVQASKRGYTAATARIRVR